MTPAQLFIALLFIGLILWLLFQNPNTRNTGKFSRVKFNNSEGISRHLLRATKGDQELAKRLLAGARRRYPGKPERWYVEKVIYDLERDGASGYHRPR